MNFSNILSKTHVDDWLANQGVDILTAAITVTLIYFLVGYVFRFFIKKAVATTAKHRDWRKNDVKKRQQTLDNLFVNLWRIATLAGFIVYVIFLVVPNARSFLAPLFASAGVIGVAVGFGTQSLVKDLISGVFIIAENQFRVGDVVQIGTNKDVSGTVERIGTRSTVLRDSQGNVHFIPNGTIQHIINKTMDYSNAKFSISINPDNDIDAVVEIINRVGSTLAKDELWKKKIISAPAFTSIGEFNSSAVTINISGKTQPADQWAVVSAMRRALLKEFEKENITLAS